jgi:hypothetical protein
VDFDPSLGPCFYKTITPLYNCEKINKSNTSVSRELGAGKPRAISFLSASVQLLGDVVVPTLWLTESNLASATQKKGKHAVHV